MSKRPQLAANRMQGVKRVETAPGETSPPNWHLEVLAPDHKSKAKNPKEITTAYKIEAADYKIALTRAAFAAQADGIEDILGIWCWGVDAAGEKDDENYQGGWADWQVDVFNFMFEFGGAITSERFAMRKAEAEASKK